MRVKMARVDCLPGFGTKMSSVPFTPGLDGVGVLEALLMSPRASAPEDAKNGNRLPVAISPLSPSPLRSVSGGPVCRYGRGLGFGAESRSAGFAASPVMGLFPQPCGGHENPSPAGLLWGTGADVGPAAAPRAALGCLGLHGDLAGAACDLWAHSAHLWAPLCSAGADSPSS